MLGGALVREARRRAGLTQRELADRLGTTQSVIARMERGRSDPSYDRVVAAVRACGLELVPTLVSEDDWDWSLGDDNLTRSVEGRIASNQNAVRFVEHGQRPRAKKRARA